MNEEIESTINDLKRTVIQFNTDTVSGNPEGLNSFVGDFIPLLQRYANLMLKPEYGSAEYYLNFKDEISAVFDYLFTDSNIFKKDENAILQNERATGTIFAIKHNGNPLNRIQDNRTKAMKRASAGNPYLQFVSIYQDRNESATPPQKIENQLIYNEKILDSFHGAFNGFLWKSTNIETFKNWFRVNPVGMPEFIDDWKRYFCYAIWKIEDHIIPELRPKNINNWFVSILGKNNYSGLKKSELVKEKKDEIDRKLSLLK